MFLGLIVEDEDNDPVATYRLTEFEVLTDIHEPNRKSKGLEFNEIIIPNSLQSYFKTIKQVNTVSLTNTQLGFGRVNMPTSKLDDSGKIVAPGDEMKPILMEYRLTYMYYLLIKYMVKACFLHLIWLLLKGGLKKMI